MIYFTYETWFFSSFFLLINTIDNSHINLQIYDIKHIYLYYMFVNQLNYLYYSIILAITALHGNLAKSN